MHLLEFTAISDNNIMEGYKTETLQECLNDCIETNLCLSFTYLNSICYLKNRLEVANFISYNALATSGTIRKSIISYFVFLFFIFIFN